MMWRPGRCAIIAEHLQQSMGACNTGLLQDLQSMERPAMHKRLSMQWFSERFSLPVSHLSFMTL